VRGWVTSLPDECCPTPRWHGFAMRDTRTPSSTGFRRRCAAGRVTLERPKVTKGLLPRLFALLRRVPSVPPFVPRHAPMGHPWPSGANNRGQQPNPQHRGQLTKPNIFGTKIGRVVISDPAPRPPYGKTKLSPPCNRYYRHGCIGEEIIVSTATRGSLPYRIMKLYRRSDIEDNYLISRTSDYASLIEPTSLIKNTPFIFQLTTTI